MEPNEVTGTTAPATPANLPDGTPNNANPVAPAAAEPAENVDKASTLVNVFRDAVVDAIQDLSKTARNLVENYVDALAPQMSEQALLMQAATDPESQARAAKNMRNLENQALLALGRYAIGVQQRQEKQLIQILKVAINFAIRAI